MSSPPHQHHYFIALLPSPELQAAVTQLKEHCRDRYHTHAALRSPPHVTLYPPFFWPKTATAILHQALDQFASGQPAVQLFFEGFGAFPPRVLYIQVRATAALRQLQKDLLAAVALPLGFPQTQHHPFTPHMTIAFRDLGKAEFEQAWSVFQHQPFYGECWVQALTLLEHRGQGWDIASTFPFQGASPQDTEVP